MNKRKPVSFGIAAHCAAGVWHWWTAALLQGLVTVLLATGAFGAQAFHSEGWWRVHCPNDPAVETQLLFRLERYQVPERGKGPVVPGLEDGSVREYPFMTLLRKHPKEAWLFTFYQAEFSLGGGGCDLSRRSVPARIEGNTVTLFYTEEERKQVYQLTNKAGRVELKLLKKHELDFNPFHPRLTDWTRPESSGPAIISEVSAEALEELKKSLLKFLP